jgi:hypothetical protein
MFSSKLNFKLDAFRCPHCGVYAKQKWHDLAKGVMSERGLDYYEGFIPGMHLSVCPKCRKNVFWLNDTIIYPAVSIAPWPTDDMPIQIREDFLEARNVLTVSPKAASALLRLCLQKLLNHLGRNGRNLDLGSIILTKKGSPQKLTDALWAVKAIGPGAVPPGEISPKDDIETATTLFELINLIVDASVSRQREVNRFYNMLPKTKSVRKRRAQAKIRTKKREIIPTPTILYR